MRRQTCNEGKREVQKREWEELTRRITKRERK